ncbi:hypothetical protein [Caenimonas sedimenti]|uniref:hypothetical protein n=1 Tax=Caenimonas sedimenti TaxID=2596921 RepID=UPI001645DC75|nr:hypothetical protein [Caenimonas sedimenti]
MMQTLKITAALSIALLLAAPVHARGGWDGNGVATSGVAQSVPSVVVSIEQPAKPQAGQ